MGNCIPIMGKKVRSRRVRRNRKDAMKVEIADCKICIGTELKFVDTDDYVWENHVYGRLPFVPPPSPEIVFYNGELWHDDMKDVGKRELWQDDKANDADQSEDSETDRMCEILDQ